MGIVCVFCLFFFCIDFMSFGLDYVFLFIMFFFFCILLVLLSWEGYKI